MPKINYSNQLNYTGKGPLDAKQQPVASYAALTDNKTVPLTTRYIGMTVTVLADEKNSNGKPAEYWLVGGTTNKYWVKKESNTSTEIFVDGDDAE